MAQANTGPEGQFVTLPQEQFHVIVEGEGPELVMIHGANSNAREFSFDLIDRMADEFRVIAFDRLGFGYLRTVLRDTPSSCLTARTDSPRPSS